MTGASCLVNNGTIVNRWTDKPRCIAMQGDVLLVCKGSGCGAIAILAQEKAHIARQFMALQAVPTLDKTFNYFLAVSVADSIKKDARGLIVGIARDAVLQQDVVIPSLPEQTDIGNFFRTLDNAIHNHQQKLNCLRELKKGYLQQMFPQNGESVPKVRFDGFTGDWKARKLGDVVERVRGNDGRMDLPTLSISAGNGWLDQRERFSGNIAGKEQENYTLLSKGELSYNKGNSKLAKLGVVFELRDFDEALVPRVYHSFKTTDDSDSAFIEYLFATKILDKELGKLITSGARMDGLLNINYDEFIGIEIVIPSIVEQIAISEFLRRLDCTANTQQLKLVQLKQLKAAYLQKMFV
jgi:type I restriction enzyme S subunit